MYDEGYSKIVFILLVIRSGLVGIGGALALSAIRIYAGEFMNHMPDLPQHIIYNFALSLIAGFAARTLLPNIAQRLERRLEQQDLKIAEQDSAVANQGQALEKTQAELEKQRANLEQQREELESRRKDHELAEVIMLGGFALIPAAVKSEIATAKDRLSKLLQEDPRSRKAAIILARILHEKDNDFDGAIGVLSEFVERNADPGANTKDLADVLYNKACYLTLKMAALQVSGADAALISKLREEAIRTLERSLALQPEGATDAADDPDFQSIRDTDEFRRVLRYA